MNEIIKSIYERKSVRAYEDRSIPEEMKQVILEAAARLRPQVVSSCIPYWILQIRR